MSLTLETVTLETQSLSRRADFEPTPTRTLSDLPEDLLTDLFFYLEINIPHIPLVCRQWSRLYFQPLFWKRLLSKHFPHIFQNLKNSALAKEDNYFNLYKEQAILKRNIQAGRFNITSFSIPYGGNCVQVQKNRLCITTFNGSFHIWELPLTTINLHTYALQVHSERISCMKMLGDRLCTGSADRTAKVWDLENQENLHILRGHTDEINCLDMNDDLLCTGSKDRTAIIWNLATGEKTYTLSGHADPIVHVEIVDNLLYTASKDTTAITIITWNITTGKWLSTFRAGFLGDINSLKIIGNLLYVGSFWNITVWNLTNSTTSYSLVGPPNNIRCLCVQDDLLCAVSGNRQLVFWDLNSRKELHTVLKDNEESISFLHMQGNKLYIASSEDRTIKILDFGLAKHYSSESCTIL